MVTPLTTCFDLMAVACYRAIAASNRNPSQPPSMPKPPEHLTLTRHQEKLIEASAIIRAEPPDRIDFLHTVQCQCGIPYKNPGDGVREWDRKQGNASLRIEAGSAIDPQHRRFREAGPALRRKAPAGADSPGHRGGPHRLAGRRCRGIDDRLRPIARPGDQRPAAASP